MYHTYVMGIDNSIFELEFLFHLQDGFKRYEVDNYVNDEVLRLCEELCNCRFESIKKMLSDNSFYKTIIE